MKLKKETRWLGCKQLETLAYLKEHKYWTYGDRPTAKYNCVASEVTLDKLVKHGLVRKVTAYVLV